MLAMLGKRVGERSTGRKGTPEDRSPGIMPLLCIINTAVDSTVIKLKSFANKKEVRCLVLWCKSTTKYKLPGKYAKKLYRIHSENI